MSDQQVMDPATLIKARKGMLIADRWTKEGSAGVFDKLNPSTGKTLALVPMAGKVEIDAAVKAAKAAFPAWRAMPASQRRDILFKFADLYDANMPAFVTLSALETGCTVYAAPFTLGIGREWLRYYAGMADKIEGRTPPSFPSPGFGYTKPEPYGVVGIILTWNFPLVSAAMKIIPALAAGNCVVVKMPELSPFGVMLFAELLEQAGIPAGVVSFLSGGPEAGQALVSHPDVNKISFTGGVRTARSVIGNAAQHITPVVLELGGKSANIVCADADLDSVIPFSVGMCMAMTGQGCALPTRMLVDRKIYAEVLERVSAIAAHLPTGDSLQAQNLIGPVITREAQQRIMGVIDDAPRQGARLIAGGKAMASDGYFIQPTVFADVDNSSFLAQEEVFGPVLSVTPFENDRAAIAMANQNLYGLAAYIQTRDVDRALWLADQFDAGYVSVNGFGGLNPALPFGGFKLSGIGKEGGSEGLNEFLRVKSVFIAQRQLQE